VELVEAGEAELAGGARASAWLASTSAVQTSTGASELIAASPVARPTCVGAQQVDEVEELLRHERLDRCGPHGAPSVVAGEQDAGHRDQALARAGGGGEHDVVAGGQRERGFLLVRVQRAVPRLGCPRTSRTRRARGQSCGSN
jgi:hypothetical protein